MATKRVVAQAKDRPSKDQDDLRAHLLEVKLNETLEALRSVSTQHNALLKDFRTLSDKYVITKQCAMDTAWRYCPEYSNEFKAMPLQDKCLHEGSKSIGDYSVLEVLGQGQFSVVKKCKKNSARAGSGTSTGIVAIKQITKDKIRGIEEVLRVERELQALKLLSPHPNIIHFVEALHGLECVYVVTELLPMDLFDFIDANHSRFDDNIVGVVISELMKAVGHLASHNIVHMDIKPENILLGLHRSPERLQVKLCDFGLCSILPDESSTLSEFCGSPGFFAPEVYIQKRFDGYKADMFSVGCVALEMLVPQDYFNEQWIRVYDALKGGDSLMLGRNVKDAIDAALKEIKKRHSRTVADCMTKLLSITPSTRPHAHEVLGLPTRKYSAESPAPDPTNVEPSVAGTACTGGSGMLNGPGSSRHPSPTPRTSSSTSNVSNSNSNGVTSPFLWLSKCSMTVAVEKLWTFSVRRNSGKVMGDCASTGGASVFTSPKSAPSPSTTPGPAIATVVTSAPSPPRTHITCVSPAVAAPKPMAAGSSKAPAPTSGSATSTIALTPTPTPAAAVAVASSTSRKHSKALINYNCGSGSVGANGSNNTSEGTNGTLDSPSHRFGVGSAFGAKETLGTNSPAGASATKKAARAARTDSAGPAPDTTESSTDDKSSASQPCVSSDTAAPMPITASTGINRQQSLSTSSNAGLEDQTMRLHSTSSAAAHIPTALNAAMVSSADASEAVIPPPFGAMAAAPSVPAVSAPLSVCRVGLPPPTLIIAHSSRDSSEIDSEGESDGLEGIVVHSDSRSNEGGGAVNKRVTDLPSNSLGTPLAGCKAASAAQRGNKHHGKLKPNPIGTAGLSDSPDFPQNDIPSILLANTPQSELPSLLHKPHAKHHYSSSGGGSDTACGKSKTPTNGTSEHHLQFHQQHLHQQQQQHQQHSLPSIGVSPTTSTSSSTTSSATASRSSTPSVILASPGAASSSATTAAATMGGVFVQNPSHFRGLFNTHSPMIPISARSTPVITTSPSTPTSLCTSNNTVACQDQGQDQDQGVGGQHNAGVTHVSALMVETGSGVTATARSTDVGRVNSTQLRRTSPTPASVAEATSSSPSVPPRHICPSPVRATDSTINQNMGSDNNSGVDSTGCMSPISPSQPQGSASPLAAGHGRPTSGLSFSSAFRRTSGSTGSSVHGNKEGSTSNKASPVDLPCALSVPLSASDAEGGITNKCQPLRCEGGSSNDSEEAGSVHCSTDNEGNSESCSPPTSSPGGKGPQRESASSSKDSDSTGDSDSAGGDDNINSREKENDNGRYEHKYERLQHKQNMLHKQLR